MNAVVQATVPLPQQTDAVVDLLLYAAVPDATMLNQGFYDAEVRGLLRHPLVRSVKTTNRLTDVWNQSYDGLICYFYSHSSLAALLARIRGKTAIATGGGEQLFREMASGAIQYIKRLAGFLATLLTATRILATSTSDLEQMRKIGFFMCRKIELSFHGAEVADAFNWGDFSAPRPPGSLVTICGMDTLLNIRRKGLLRAIDLVAENRDRHPELRLTVIGRTTCGDFVRDYARQRGCADSILFAGYVSENEKRRILKESRYYLQLSDYEGFGIGALEALACGCEVIHSNVGGLRDTIGSFGQIMSATGSLGSVDLEHDYAIADHDQFERHIARFRSDFRSDTIMAALRLP